MPTTTSVSSPQPPTSTQSWKDTVVENISDDPSHPLQIALRTYSLCLSLSLGPGLLPVVLALAVRPKSFKARATVFWRLLKRELRPTGFATAITVAIGGGAALQRFWDSLETRDTHRDPQSTISAVFPSLSAWFHSSTSKLSQHQRAFLANVITSTFAVILLRWRGRRRPGAVSPTLDLTLLFLVRSLDASVQLLLSRKANEIGARQAPTQSCNDVSSGPQISLTLNGVSHPLEKHDDPAKEWQKKIATRLDALVFWVSSARIMWCFFYQPHRLPPAYLKWINSIANVDRRLLQILRARREGTWTYIQHSSPEGDTACSLAEELGYPAAWGDPSLLPAYGGRVADVAWKELGVVGRDGIGGLPCELVHSGIAARFGLANSCVANAAVRAAYAFVEALAIYLPVHFVPLLLTKPSSILRLHRALPALLSAIRSASFLSVFVSSYWFAVCFTRTLVLGRLFPGISHDVWDGPYGCAFAGSLLCGASIWIENARRRGEMSLYVLPKALRASIPEKWLRSGHPVVQLMECLTFVVSLASLLTFSVHEPDSLRGLSRWTLAFIMKGPNAGFWKKRKRQIATCPPTPLPVNSTTPSYPFNNGVGSHSSQNLVTAEQQ